MTDEKKVPEWVGTVSHATMRWEDLIPAFTDFLHEIWRGEVFTKEECPDQHLAVLASISNSYRMVVTVSSSTVYVFSSAISYLLKMVELP